MSGHRPVAVVRGYGQRVNRNRIAVVEPKLDGGLKLSSRRRFLRDSQDSGGSSALGRLHLLARTASLRRHDANRDAWWGHARIVEVQHLKLARTKQRVTGRFLNSRGSCVPSDAAHATEISYSNVHVRKIDLGDSDAHIRAAKLPQIETFADSQLDGFLIHRVC